MSSPKKTVQDSGSAKSVRRSVPHSVASDGERSKQLHFLDPKTSAARDAQIENASELVVEKLPPPQIVAGTASSREHTKQLHFLNPKAADKRDANVNDFVAPQENDPTRSPVPQEQAIPMDPEKAKVKQSMQFLTKEQRLAAQDRKDAKVANYGMGKGLQETKGANVTPSAQDAQVTKEAKPISGDQILTPEQRQAALDAKETKPASGDQFLTPEQRQAALDAKDKNVRVAGYLDESSKSNNDFLTPEQRQAKEKSSRVAGYLDGSSDNNNFLAPEQQEAKQKNLRVAGYLDGSSNNNNNVTVPTTAMRRGDYMNVESAPGAVAVGGLDGSRMDGSRYSNTGGQGMEASQASQDMDDSKAGLARAMPVLDESVKHQADEVGLEVLKEEDEKRFKRREEAARKNILIGFFGISLLIIAVAIGIVVGLRKRDDSKSTTVVANPTLSPSEAPSQSPTAAPTAYILHFPDFTVEKLAQPNSPQSRAYSWLMNDPHLETYPAWRQMQRFALATFYYATGGDVSWERNDGWLDYEVSECEWFHKGNMRLQLMEMKGTFSQLLINLFLGWYRYNSYEDFGSFWEGGDELEYYDLPCGASPEQELGDPDAHFRFRRFWLQNNVLDGAIPDEVGLLSSLEDWSMAHNHGLRGTFPTQIGNLHNLWHMSLEDCGLTTHLPSEIGLLTNMVSISLVAQPGLKGKVPSEIGLLSNKLMYFDIPITQPLPTEIGLLTNLEFFSPQSSTAGMGSIPSELGLLTKLRLMNILDSPELGGTIPTELGQLSLLEMGQVRGTAVGGSLPSFLGQLSLMKVFLLDHNSFTGTLPTELALLTDLEEFVADGNPLEGPLPTGFGDAAWPNLELLSLTETFITGNIPNHSCPFVVFDCSESLCGCDCSCPGR